VRFPLVGFPMVGRGERTLKEPTLVVKGTVVRSELRAGERAGARRRDSVSHRELDPQCLTLLTLLTQTSAPAAFFADTGAERVADSRAPCYVHARVRRGVGGTESWRRRSGILGAIVASVGAGNG
jgi:hypothetical protein